MYPAENTYARQRYPRSQVAILAARRSIIDDRAFVVAAASLCNTTGLPCSNAAKTRKPLKLAGVPQTTGPISAASGPMFTILWGCLGDIVLLNIFSDCRYVP